MGASFSFKYPPTQDHIAAVLGKKIYIIGGMQLFPEREKNRLHPLNEIFVIDTDTSQGKTDKAALRQEIRSTLPNTFGSGCAVAKQKIYLFGGGLNPAEKIPRYSNDLFCFDVNLTEWLGVSVKGEKPAGRSGLGMCTIGDQIVLFGGYGPQHDDSFRKRGFSWKQRRKGGEGGWNNELAVFDLKDPYEGVWKWPAEGRQLNWPLARTGHTLTPTKNRQIVLYGGNNWTGTLSDLHVLSADTWTWTEVSGHADCPMPAVSFHSATFVEGKSGIGLLLILGGKKEIKNETAVESITVTEDTVIALDTGVSFSLSHPGIARSSHTVSQVPNSGDKPTTLYIHGGLDQDGNTTNKSQLLQWSAECPTSLIHLKSFTSVVPTTHDPRSSEFQQKIIEKQQERIRKIQTGEEDKVTEATRSHTFPSVDKPQKRKQQTDATEKKTNNLNRKNNECNTSDESL
ncbi:kelch domain-containing protein 2-like [Oscarella lobularis]|uniref:kelch domain-containing protein 2-like n=1 Tax=Oscarella lobularis TaxID=121494 RepID=UPI0033134B79